MLRCLSRFPILFPFYQRHVLVRSVLALALLALAACGGGGSSKASSEGSQPEIDPDPSILSSISGSIVVERYSSVDRDIEAVGTDSIVQNNNSFEEAQALNNPVTMGGYLSSTDGYYDLDLTSSQFLSDPLDVFEIDLVSGQQVSISAYYASSADRISSAPFDVSLDLVRSSDRVQLESLNLLEPGSDSLSVAESGEYFLLVRTGGSVVPVLYTLSVSQSIGSAVSTSLANTQYDVNDEFVPGEVIVSFKNDSNQQDAKEFVSSLSSKSRSVAPSLGMSEEFKQDLGAAKVYRLPETALARQLSFPASSSMSVAHQRKWQTLVAIESIKQRDDVEYAEPNYVHKAFAINDARYSQQWNMQMLNMPTAWSSSAGAGTIVAVVDSGIHPDHQDLNDNILSSGYDFVSVPDFEGDSDAGIDDDPTDTGDTYHGSHVSGIIAAEANTIGIRGVAFNAEIMPLRALGVDGVGSTTDIVNAVRYAAGLSNASGTVPPVTADVINLSLGSTSYSQSFANTIAEVTANNIFVVAAAGNESTSSATYPAAYNGVIGVSSVDSDKERSSFSNFGSYVDITAPGGSGPSNDSFDGFRDGVLSTVYASSYAEFAGTSMAAPHVSGVIALMKALDSTLTPSEFNSYLSSGLLTDDIDDPRYSEANNRAFFGAGLVNAVKAVQAVGSSVSASLVAYPQDLAFLNGESSLNLNLSNPGSGLLEIDSIIGAPTWLSITAPGNSDGLGDYLVEVSLPQVSNLESTELEIYYSVDGVSVAEPLVVPILVSKTVSLVDTVGSTLTAYLLRYEDIENAQVSGDTSVDVYAYVDAQLVDGVYSFEFSNIPSGLYMLEASTDNDGDNFLFDQGEAIGVYPLLGDARLISLSGQNLSGLEFEVAYPAYISGSAALDASLDEGFMPRRLPSQSSEVRRAQR